MRNNKKHPAHLLWSQPLCSAGLCREFSFPKGLKALVYVHKEQMHGTVKKSNYFYSRKAHSPPPPLHNCCPLCRPLVTSQLPLLKPCLKFLLSWVKLSHFISQNCSCLRSCQPLCSAQFQRIIYWSKHRFHASIM